MKTKRYIKGDLIQALSIVTVVAGICIELVTHAHFCHLIITGGAFLFAIGTKVKHGGI